MYSDWNTQSDFQLSSLMYSSFNKVDWKKFKLTEKTVISWTNKNRSCPICCSFDSKGKVKKFLIRLIWHGKISLS